jgi:hypothetical protein
VEWVEDYREYKKELKEWTKGKGQIKGVILAKCSAAMTNKLESHPTFKQIDQDNDVCKLIKLIKNIIYSTEATQYQPWILADALTSLLTCTQHKGESFVSFHRRWYGYLETLEAKWGKLAPTTLPSGSTRDEERNKLAACLFLKCVRKTPIVAANLDNLHTNYRLSNGNTTYPKDPEDALDFLDKHCHTSYDPKQTPKTSGDNTATRTESSYCQTKTTVVSKAKAPKAKAKTDTAKPTTDSTPSVWAQDDEASAGDTITYTPKYTKVTRDTHPELFQTWSSYDYE